MLAHRLPAVLVLAMLLVPAGATGALAQAEPVLDLDWENTPPLSGEVIDGSVLVEGDGSVVLFPLSIIDDPQLGGDYSLVGRVRHQAVGGRGYLEMWSVFADGGRYFTRTLADGGPMGALAGDSDWRAVELPMYLNGSPPPVRLELNVVLPQGGRVWVSELQLYQATTSAQPAAWWGDGTGGLIGGLGGTLLGVFGGLMGWMVPRRRARRFVLGVSMAGAALGISSLAAGAVAWTGGQPFGVYFPLLLLGGIATAEFGYAYFEIRRLYVESEMRKIRALDLA